MNVSDLLESAVVMILVGIICFLFGLVTGSDIRETQFEKDCIGMGAARVDSNTFTCSRKDAK
jgi:hypothetical protein